MTILIVNSLDERYGSTYRLRAFSEALKGQYNVTYIENSGGACLKLYVAAKAAWTASYTYLLTQKFNPITVTCILIARARGKKVVVDWDDWDVGFQSNLLKKIVSWACECIGPRFVHFLTTHSRPIFEHAHRIKPTTLVQQGYDAKLFNSFKSHGILRRQKWKIPDDHQVIGHMCTFTHGGTLDLDVILRAWSRIQSDQITFVLIGGGPLEKEIRRKLDHFGVQSKVILTGLMPHHHMPEMLSLLDMGVVYMSDRPSNMSRVSFKVIEYLAMGIPVVGKVVGETQSLFGDCIFAVDGEQKFSEKITEILEISKSSRLPCPHIQDFSWEKTTKPLLNLIQTMESASCH